MFGRCNLGFVLFFGTGEWTNTSLPGLQMCVCCEWSEKQTVWMSNVHFLSRVIQIDAVTVPVACEDALRCFASTQEILVRLYRWETSIWWNQQLSYLLFGWEPLRGSRERNRLEDVTAPVLSRIYPQIRRIFLRKRHRVQATNALFYYPVFNNLIRIDLVC